ncbi:PD-(D/E)XK nuclease family protein [Acinetobacter junii]|uniref:PD-(D/E)XK nuclease family protein n=1 Tax=Acinetobacter junii TaxID=40215 RepID=UPI0009505158|nr:PD-(D/E)XK nuclease family protein [Acinetobacter junii]APU47162.1 nuclease [Acinetobacter junii]MEB8382606.1 PD-(D/E)XK nuclease family protein [Acinetobacter junii]TIE05358.1 nuclease [Acinetobacter junii]
MNLATSSFEHFTQLLDSAKKFKAIPREKTFFDTAIRNHYENPTTELLEFFLNPQESHELGEVFWKGFSDVVVGMSTLENSSLGQVENLERECVTHNSNRIDLMIDTDTHLILLEAKIYHHQNNPFDDYVKYAQTRSKDKTILGLILSISGKSEAKNWHGISYQQLVNAVRPYLAEQMMTNPMNKWNLFAREFLLHLESYYRTQKLDMNRIQFIFDHYQEIQELQKLKTNTIQEVVDSISQLLNQSIDGYISRNKYESWGGIRFYNDAWNIPTNNTLYIYEDQGETIFGVNTYILNLPEKLNEKVFEILKSQDDSRYLSWDIEKYKNGTERWLCIYWRASENNFESIRDLILEKASLLDVIEKTLR